MTKVLLAGYLLGRGGIQSHLKWLSKMLGEEGIDTLVLSLGNEEASPEDWKDLQKFQHGKVEFVCCPPSQGRGLYSVISQLQRLQAITRMIQEFSPDIYYAVGMGWNLVLPPLLSWSKARRIFHEVMSGVSNGLSDPRWGVRWWFNDVIGQSATVSKTFAQCFGWTNPIIALPAIPEPLEVSAQLPYPTVKQVELGRAKAALFSRLVPHKQAFWLVQQWHLLKDVLGELHIHGSGPEESSIREYIETQGIGDRVKCLGPYPQGQAYVDLLSSYDLTLLPTIGAEGAPLVLLESMACGVPFVAYGVGGVPDYGVDNPDVLIVQPESNLFVAGIQQMVLKLSRGEIDPVRLQRFYLERYSYTVLKTMWLSYLCARRSK
jgi:glycosyltransferase involved in cell wall biosynthesis